MRMVRKDMRAHSRMNDRKGGTATPDRSTSSMNLTDMRTILEEHRNEMHKAINTLPKTVEKQVLAELERRKLLSPRIIEGDLH